LLRFALALAVLAGILVPPTAHLLRESLEPPIGGIVGVLVWTVAWFGLSAFTARITFQLENLPGWCALTVTVGYSVGSVAAIVGDPAGGYRRSWALRVALSFLFAATAAGAGAWLGTLAKTSDSADR
jgi:hypothetical protein